jgi:hypothetical protein
VKIRVHRENPIAKDWNDDLRDTREYQLPCKRPRCSGRRILIRVYCGSPQGWTHIHQLGDADT